MSVQPHREWFGSDETDAVALTPLQLIGEQQFVGTPGNDHIKGSDDDDYFDLSQGGNDRVYGKDGGDTFYFGAAFTSEDRVVGGAGAHGANYASDVLVLDGDYSDGVVFDSAEHLLKIVLLGGSYRVTGEFHFGNPTGSIIDASGLTNEQVLTVDAISRGQTSITGGAADDVLTLEKAEFSSLQAFLAGGDGNDILSSLDGKRPTSFLGGAGGDEIQMANEGDYLLYDLSSDSVKGASDLVHGFKGTIRIFFDSDTSVDGIQHDFHIGKTVDHAGDIVIHYNPKADFTVVNISTDGDAKPEFVLHLVGNVSLTVQDFMFG